jgi:uncharacterized membrane-anchored protein YitT (DUF2179 family)
MNAMARFRAHFVGLFFAVFFMLLAVNANAVIDVADALTAITDGSTAVVAIIGGLIVAYGLFLGLRMALRAVKRGG